MYYDMVENVIRTLGVDPAQCRGEKEGMWRVFKGSAEVWIDIWNIENESRGYFQVMAPIMPVPADNCEQFFRELLELNDQMFGVSFSLFKEWCYIKTIREVENLEQTEIASTLNRVGNYSDQFDEVLKTKYGAIPPPQNPGAPPA